MGDIYWVGTAVVCSIVLFNVDEIKPTMKVEFLDAQPAVEYGLDGTLRKP